jgi:PAS domain S-box-containing protein
MVFTTRADGYCDYQSQQWVDYTGVPMDEHLGNGWNRLLHPDDQGRAMAAWRDAVAGRAPYDLEYRVRRHDGEYQWFKVMGHPVRDDAGNVARWFGVALNIEEHKRADAALEASLREKEVLLKEVHHRVKNNLQVISSLVNLQADAVRDPALLDVLRDVRDRVRTIALVHQGLYQSGNLAEVDFARYAAELLENLWRSHDAAAAAVKLKLELEPVALSVEEAVPCGLILNELASNALEHAFPGRAGGEVTVVLTVVAEDRVQLTFRDDGVGLPESFDWQRSPTLGLQLVQMLTRQLEATVDVKRDGGTEFAVVFQPRSLLAFPRRRG